VDKPVSPGTFPVQGSLRQRIGARATAQAPNAPNSIPNAMSSTIPVRNIRFAIAASRGVEGDYVLVLFF
jgi:hypothetical protein